ncbi:cAMP-binding domain of CRP or a regulatory subunit of cAMP-dependent protein kinases [Roseomonas rosea]|jgi:CRP-like cAMP-binding protein|uniref:cAMP-binding domain of CRP or a regulatory subunit of cAMP-dependent protein kinases n=1 Tax=Muricoccus roseus TaxID=198092 RepID=A0A1M6FNN5_9PROT|nr:Crp/Fnr family transcriptional regulator [Roseomonas rosea]SHI99286.1 cAMP-binding domain of CRP or a regulatory subunit of cAMP-dependent protein kinases [Roseomonas rosea]
MATSPHRSSIRNRLLKALPPESLDRILPKLVPVELPLRKQLYQPDRPIEAAYFPEEGIISMVSVLDEGMQAEVGMAGREGMLGTPLLAGVETSFVESMVQLGGSGLRMEAHAFRDEVEANRPFRTLLLHYSEAHQAQMIQTAACNGNHGLEQRFARWLLMVHDRVDGDEMSLTQEFIAVMLSVHRPSVTVAAGILQRAGLIRYAAGRVTMLDRPGLEAVCCECYGAVRRRFETVMGQPVS